MAEQNCVAVKDKRVKATGLVRLLWWENPLQIYYSMRQRWSVQWLLSCLISVSVPRSGSIVSCHHEDFSDGNLVLVWKTVVTWTGTVCSTLLKLVRFSFGSSAVLVFLISAYPFCFYFYFHHVVPRIPSRRLSEREKRERTRRGGDKYHIMSCSFYYCLCGTWREKNKKGFCIQSRHRCAPCPSLVFASRTSRTALQHLVTAVSATTRSLILLHPGSHIPLACHVSICQESCDGRVWHGWENAAIADFEPFSKAFRASNRWQCESLNVERSAWEIQKRFSKDF